MPVLTPTKDKGATAKPAPALYVEPALQVSDETLSAFLPDSGMNGAFLADLMSGMLTHERCGRHLYRMCERRSNDPELQAKYREFGEETERHVEILEQLVVAAGGDPCYVSPTARVVEAMNSKMVEATVATSGSIDPMTEEMSLLDAVFHAESMDHANWKLLRTLTESMPDGALRDQFEAAVDEVEDEEDEHLEWATSTKERLVLRQATSS